MLPRAGAISERLAASNARRYLVATGAVVAACGLPLLGVLAGSHALVALAVGGILLLVGILLIDIRFFPILAIPCTLLVLRAGGGSGLSMSDFVLFLGTLCALTVVRVKESPELRRLLWLLAFYQATTLLTVVYNPYRANVIEWIHEAFLVGGSLIVGWVVARSGRTKPAVTTYVLGSCFIAAWACLQTLTHHLQPAYLPGGMQKNYIGDMLAFAVLLLYARPAWFGWKGTRWPRFAIVVCLLGILATQSKQAMISCALGVVFMVVRDRSLRRRSRAILIGLLPAVVIAYEVVSREVTSHNRFNSVYTRLSWFSDGISIWHTSPLVGVGLRWWYTDRFAVAFQPPNGVIEMLSSAGVLGVIGFLALMVGSIAILWRVPRPAGTLAVGILLTRFLQGELDLFWVGAQGSLPWLVAGLALGAVARQYARSTQGLSAPRPLYERRALRPPARFHPTS